MRHARPAAACALVLGAVLAGAIACDGSPPGGRAPDEAPGTDVPGTPDPVGPKQSFAFQLADARTWNGQMYYAVGEAVDGPGPYTGAIMNDRGGFTVEGPPGARYHVRSEKSPSPAEQQLLWMTEARGTLGATPGPVVVPGPPRATVVLTAPAGTGGPDAITFYDEETGACATAWRDPRHAYFLSVWDARGGNAWRWIAPPRPWRMDEIRPGTYVVGGVTQGRQWTARRATIDPGGTLEIDAGAAPPGGGTLVCEDGQALLLLGGELAIPAPRITTSLAFRSTWHGVPPGRHQVRYPDGRVVDVEVAEGGTTKIGK